MTNFTARENTNENRALKSFFSFPRRKYFMLSDPRLLLSTVDDQLLELPKRLCLSLLTAAVFLSCSPMVCVRFSVEDSGD